MSKETFLRELLERMSIREKAGQLNLLTGTMDATGMKHSDDLAEKIRSGDCGAVLNVYTPEATRALQQLALSGPRRIPLLFGYDVIHGHRTIFPIPLAMACSWNMELLERCARAAATEAAADGLHWVFSPMVDISHDPRWGRVAEGAGEDPWLGAKIAAAMVRGYQGDDLGHPTSVVACVKHFALYGAPMGGRDYHTVDMSRRAMEDTYFPPYRAAVDAGARTVMTSFNDIDGIPASGNRWLLKELLRDRWKFQGWIVTDYTAVTEMKNHGTAASDGDAARQSLDAGVDMDMVSEAFLNHLPELVESGAVSESQLDAAVMRVLETKWDLGLFSDAYARCGGEIQIHHPAPEHRRLAREAARESIVLLKNDRGVLPLAKHGTLAIIGPLADSSRDMLGSWIAAGNETDAVSVYQGIRQALGGHEKVIHAKGCEMETEDDGLLAEAVRAASHADHVILVVGESWQMSGEAASRSNIRLAKCQRRLAKRILKTGKPCVLVTMSGRPLELSSEDAKFHTILHAWQLGTEGGNALADIIFGDAAPVGKLTMGFPRSVGQLPMTYREKPTGRPFDAEIQYSSKYLDVGNDALYPFGHGLTYGEMEIRDLSLSSPVMKTGETLTISVEVGNSQGHPVTETFQLYLRDLVASVTRPLKELRGYQRVTLAPGETRTISFPIRDTELAFLGRDLKPVVEPGEFEVMVGTCSTKVSRARFNLI
ncbi:beta-glucosidase BglX [Luteolibacter yonseiensis]|uniref:beta-glucosidase n=1 Tax=Luteolibacter yonseiensis TaxID=1144680 RepID=A0A934R4J3_9BACT|nr:beta-glucosidase BglX [Luteolibacter yonseiensis]MBK1816792.1 beta-glucosidase BglX [Luteolibacter yonseiensis]